MSKKIKLVVVAANEQGFVQYGKSRNESSALAHSQIEKRMMSFVLPPILHKAQCYGQYGQNNY